MKLKIGDDVIVSSKAGTNPGTTGTVIQFTEFESGFQYGTIYEVRYHGVFRYPYLLHVLLIRTP